MPSETRMPAAEQAITPAPASQNAHNGQQRRPMRRRIAGSKAAVMSPEARAAARQRDVDMIDEFLARQKATQCPDRWAMGAVSLSMFGTAEG